MNIVAPNIQTYIAKWSAGLGSLVAGGLYISGYPWLAFGMVFGLTLMIVNWRALSKILRVAFQFSSPITTRVVAFLFYHIRFWLLVLIMFLVIPRTNLYFGIGTFLGLLIPKCVMGIFLYQSRGREWWLDRFPNKRFTQNNISHLEKELLNKNPFEVDPLEVEIKRYYESLKEAK